MKTSPFAPWSDAASAPAPLPEPDASDPLREAAQQLQEAAARLASLSPGGAEAVGGSGPLALQITVTPPAGEPLAFDAETGPDLSLLP